MVCHCTTMVPIYHWKWELVEGVISKLLNGHLSVQLVEDSETIPEVGPLWRSRTRSYLQKFAARYVHSIFKKTDGGVVDPAKELVTGSLSVSHVSAPIAVRPQTKMALLFRRIARCGMSYEIHTTS